MTEDIWESTLAESLARIEVNKAPPNTWSAHINALARRGAISQEEIRATQLHNWLASRSVIRKDEVIAYVQSRAISLREIILGDARPAALLDAAFMNNPDGYSWEIDSFDRDIISFFDRDGEMIDLEELPDDLSAAALRFQNSTHNGATIHSKYADHQLSDGTAYRETLLQLHEPSRTDPAFISKHWDQANIVLHMRSNVRDDAEGNAILFVEEIQSDWAQQGRLHGFAQGDVPAGPFVTKTDAWVTLAITRLLKMAVDEGLHSVAFITGRDAHARFDAAKSLKSISASAVGPDGARTLSIHFAHVGWPDPIDVVIDRQGTVADRGNLFLAGKSLAEICGRDLAKEILGNPLQQHLVDEHLKTDGRGMSVFYDVIVPKVAKQVIQKLTGEHLSQAQPTSSNRADGFVIPITPALRDRLHAKIPLFLTSHSHAAVTLSPR